MNDVDNKLILHQNNSHIYKTKDIPKFTKIIKEYMTADEEIGRESTTASELYKYTSDSYEMFRKILNAQKTTNKRDYIILIGIILRMDSDEISTLLSCYGMPVLNPIYDDRDSKLADIADAAESDEDQTKRLSEAEINKKLEEANFPGLEIKSNHKQKERTSAFEIARIESYTTGDYQTFDLYDSIATKYDFHRYQFGSKMYVIEKATKQKYVLHADDSGFYSSEPYPWPDDGEVHIQIYKSLEEASQFAECFREMLKCVHGEKRRIEGLLNDSKNFGERIGAGVKDDTFHIFIESYNYDIPERGEYYLLELKNGIYQMFVYNESVFMKLYLPEKEYKMHYKVTSSKAIEQYQTEEDISTRISDKKFQFEDEILYRSRLRYYKKLKKHAAECFEKICYGQEYVRNLDSIFYDEPDRVCSFFDVAEQFDCQENERGIYSANKENHEFHCAYGNVMITLEDLYSAFKIGYNSMDEICRVKFRTGDVMSILEMGLN